MNKKYIFLCSIILIFLAFFTLSADVVFAADNLTNLDKVDKDNVTKFKASFDNTMGTEFSSTLSNLFLSFQSVARIIVVIMTAMAGMMIAFGVGGASQMFFKWIFGVGVALNVASVGWDLFGNYWIDPSDIKASDEISAKSKADLEKFTKIVPASETDGHTFDVFSSFMEFYSNEFVVPAYQRLMPIAVKMTMVLWFIDTSMKIALGLTQQDLINFFTKQFLKLGIYIFLITNWWSAAVTGSSGNSNQGKAAYDLSVKAGGDLQIWKSLGAGFENLGYYAAGGGELPNGEGGTISLQANNIYENSFQLWSTLWATMSNADADTWEGKKAPTKVKEEKSWWSRGWEAIKAVTLVKTIVPMLVIDIVLLLCMVTLLLLIAIEMFVARLEFYTMAVLTVMLLPFAMIDQLKFLADKAISLMFNLAIKCFVIAFISVAVVKILKHYIENDNAFLPWFLDIGIVLQLGVVIILLFLLVKKLPALCNGLLSGNPSLSGGDVAGTLTKAVGVAAAAVVTGGAGAAAGAAGATGGMAAKLMGGIKGGMGAMGRGAMNYALTQNPVGQSFAQGMNLFSGNGQNPGLMQKGGLSQALGLSTRDVATGETKSVLDKMKNDYGDKSKDGDKKGGSSTDNNTQNQPQMAAQGNTGGEKTIEKQIGTVSEKLDRVERMLQGLNPNTSVRNSDMAKLPKFSAVLPKGSSGGLQYTKLPNSSPGNISADGKFAKAQVMSPKGGNSTFAWVPVSAPASGQVSHKDIVSHKKSKK